MFDARHVALDLVRTGHRLPNSRDVAPLWEQSDIMGWPESLGRNTSHTWTVLAELGTYMPWVREIFGEAEDWSVALTAYYMALNVNEFASVVSRNPSVLDSHDRLHLSIPLTFATMPDHVARRAMSLLTEDASFLDWIFTSAGTTRAKASPHWDTWVRICNGWLGQVYRFAFQGVPHANLLRTVP
ncbi:hypothetical protein QCE63_34380 [Caballeronia sp. LZ065]|uniref:hypothetical protein n=1 Tax=Caballeronia sp. LZ065 TaxID=3038571 RepID=UPI0028625DCE|nr:hypothetical protein [Caballeronia sp. LZ065]MDR5784499.1 hypothetical protein [Caballeronia sp. LZ065]